MHGWSRPKKRALLAAMLSPVALMFAATASVAALFGSEDPSGIVATLGFACLLGGFGIALGCGLACVVDATRGERIGPGTPRAGWAIALLLGPAVAGPSYWWLHVRPDPGAPHGLQILRPAHQWPAGLKAATGAGTVLVLLFLLGWAAWMTSLALATEPFEPAVPMFAAFAVWTVLACVVMTLLVLDALREGGTHAGIWVTLLVFAWALAAPLYWWLYVRPTGRPDAAP